MDLLRRGTNKEKEQYISICGRWYLPCCWYQLCLVSPKLSDLEKHIQKTQLQLLVKQPLLAYLCGLSASVFPCYPLSASFLCLPTFFSQCSNKNIKSFPWILEMFQLINTMNISIIHLTLVSVPLSKFHLYRYH